MNLRVSIPTSLLLGVYVGLPLCVAEEPQKPPSPKPDVAKLLPAGQDPASTEATVEKIMEQAVRNIARRYNLNEAQTQETDKIMKREVRRFLKEHEKEVWPLIRDLLGSQLRGKAPDDKEEVKRIGKAAKPLAKLAQETIIHANMEWRQFLTAEQQKMHDWDMQEMQKTFGQIDKNFSDWESGTPTDGPVIPTTEIAGSPPRPKQPPPGLPGPERRYLDPDVFEAIVDKFIKDYEPDQGQIDAARSLLSEAKTKATDFQTSNKSELEALDRRQNAARANRQQDELVAVEAERKKILEPFHAMVHELETRLKGLLTTVQLEKHAQRQQAPGGKLKDASTAKSPTGKRRTTAQDAAKTPAAQPPAPQPGAEAPKTVDQSSDQAKPAPPSEDKPPSGNP